MKSHILNFRLAFGKRNSKSKKGQECYYQTCLRRSPIVIQHIVNAAQPFWPSSLPYLYVLLVVECSAEKKYSPLSWLNILSFGVKEIAYVIFVNQFSQIGVRCCRNSWTHFLTFLCTDLLYVTQTKHSSRQPGCFKPGSIMLASPASFRQVDRISALRDFSFNQIYTFVLFLPFTAN